MLLCCRPDLSFLEPVAVGSAAALHIFESGGIDVTGSLGIAGGAFVSTATMRPAVLARCGVARIGIIACAVAFVGATSTSTGGIAWSWAGARRSSALGGTHEGHHLLHLEEKGIFAGLKVGLTALQGISQSSGRHNWDSRDGFRGWLHDIKKAVRYQFGNGFDVVGLVSWLLMVDIGRSWESVKITLGIAKMNKHVGPSAFTGDSPIP